MEELTELFNQIDLFVKNLDRNIYSDAEIAQNYYYFNVFKKLMLNMLNFTPEQKVSLKRREGYQEKTFLKNEDGSYVVDTTGSLIEIK